MVLSGHVIGTYCGPHSIRHVVRETCSGCGARPGRRCRWAAVQELYGGVAPDQLQVGDIFSRLEYVGFLRSPRGWLRGVKVRRSYRVTSASTGPGGVIGYEPTD
jgi:hypothetical protein